MSYYPTNIDMAVKRECSKRRLSKQTAKTYLGCINIFLKWSGKSIQHISKKDVRIYLEKLDRENKASSTININHMALKFFFEQVMNKKMWINIKYSKVRKKLPIVLTKEEVKKLGTSPNFELNF